MIELKNIKKVYKNGNENSVVLRDMSLTITEGEFVAIVGQSGSGKSTIMNIIGGLTTPTEGSIKYRHKDIHTLSQKALSRYRRETIGFVFQDFNLEGNETVLDNLLTPMIFAGVNIIERKRRAIDVLEKVNLKDKMNNNANELSGGQKQRVAIARALINNPKIILADEPTGNLDSKNSEDIMNLLKELNNKGYTIIMVTHNVEQSYIADRIIKLKDGDIVKEINTKQEKALEGEMELKKEEEEIEDKIKNLVSLLNDKEIENLFSNYILKGTGAKVGAIKKKLEKELLNIEKEV